MSEAEIIYTDPEILSQKIDWEGWPDALEWFAKDRFEDHELDELVYNAIKAHAVLDQIRHKLEKRLDELLGTENGQT